MATLHPEIVLVPPWYGPDTAGGAETQARHLARALTDLGLRVEVWSSTGRDAGHPDDVAHYPTGNSLLDGIPVRRFPPTPTDAQGVPRFFRERFTPDLGRFPEHELRLLSTLLSSDGLYAAIAAEPLARFIFLPYPFPTTFWGSQIAPERSWVLPCLHDEPYARYSTYCTMFEAVRGMLFNSPGEATLARRLYRIPEERMHLAGEGINLGWQGDAARFRQKYGLRDSTHLLLSISRRDVTKNLPLLLSYAREYWACRATDLRLVLIGPPAPNPVFVPDNLGDLVLDLGFVPEQDKHDACAAAAVVAHPSPIESFSIALMEGWLQGAPALVYRDCEVTRDHCERSGGGLWFGSFGEFAAALDLLLPQPNLRRALGANGRNYVLQTCRWDEVARRTAKAVLSSEF